MKMKLFGIFFLLTAPIGCSAMYDSTTTFAQPTEHLNYPLCVGEFLHKIKRHTPECNIGCEMLLMSDPGFLEKHVNIVSGSFTAEEKETMLVKMCVLKCEACKKMIINLLKSEL